VRVSPVELENTQAPDGLHAAAVPRGLTNPARALAYVTPAQLGLIAPAPGFRPSRELAALALTRRLARLPAPAARLGSKCINSNCCVLARVA
jgi:hypothetical protein